MNEKSKKSGKTTLFWSVLMSSPGPLVVGIGLLVGKSSTQLADFIRRTIELLAIISSFVIFLLTTKEGNTDEVKKKKLEKASSVFVAFAMIISGVIMLILALTQKEEETGNVIFGLIIALLGVVANCIFWFKYKKLGKLSGNELLKAQSNLYRAKTFVDLSVTVSLFVLLIFPSTKTAYYFDLVGTVCVSVYLALTGATSLIKQFKNK